MKMLNIAVAFTAVAVTCPENCMPYKDSCACEAKQATVPEVDYTSDEKPRKGQQPEWETGEVKVIQVPNLAAQDAEWDREKAKADLEGKQAAGIQ